MSDIDREDLRFHILYLLLREPGYTANQEALRRKLQGSGITVTRDAVRTELAWMDNINAVVNRETQGVFIATLADEGEEHLQNAREIPGIRRPTAAELRSIAESH